MINTLVKRPHDRYALKHLQVVKILCASAVEDTVLGSTTYLAVQ